VSRTVPKSAAVFTLASAFALGMSAALSHAAVQERGELIAFPAGGGEDPRSISTIKPDGTNRRRVLGQDRKRFRVGPSGPEWSPDGKKLLFGGHYHLDHPAQALWYSTASGKQITRIPLGFSRSRRRSPRAVRLYGWDWAPGGRRVVFAAQTRFAGGPRLYMISIDGRDRRALRRGVWPEWSSDGRHIVFTLGAPSFDGNYPAGPIAVMRPSGRGFRILAGSVGDAGPRLSPDGQRVLLATSRLRAQLSGT
jgi:Tol biopolymer transport system component